MINKSGHTMINGTIGEIRLFAGDFAPRSWAFCDGRVLPIFQNMALYSILRTRYGGDGTTTFQLPNLEPLKEADGGETPIRYIRHVPSYSINQSSSRPNKT
jgi:microcystin-dependent protein